MLAVHRVYFIEDGAIYFLPADRFLACVKMKPKVSRLAANGDIWKAIMGDAVPALRGPVPDTEYGGEA